MSLLVCSVYDSVKEKSVFLTCHENTADAIREFKKVCENPQLAGIKNDLVLYAVGEFDTHMPELIGYDTLDDVYRVLAYGKDFGGDVNAENT